MNESEIMPILMQILARLDGIDRSNEILASGMLRLEARMDRLETRVGSLETFTREGFLSVYDMFATLNSRIDHLDTRLGTLEASVAYLAMRTTAFEASLKALQDEFTNVNKSLDKLNVRMDGLGDDMRQRFRNVSDRMIAIEKKIAA